MDPSIGDLNTTPPDRPSGGHTYTLKPGEVLGQYKIIKPLGAGGMGEVYLVENIQMHKRYALKVLPQALSRDPQFIGRFKVEARVMADLSHPHIVGVHTMGEERGLYYLVMDYVAGPDGEPQTLEDELRDEGGGLKPESVKDIGLQICDALAYAHGFRDGVIHRDLKPSNILMDENGQVKVSDFGLAKVVGESYLKSVIERSISLSIGGQVSMGDAETERPKYEKTSAPSPLLPRVGELFVESEPRGATLHLPGFSPRRMPVDMLNVPVGVYTARVELAGHYDAELIVPVRPNQLTKTNVVLRRHVGAVRIASEPPGAEIYRGQERLGRTPEIITNLHTGAQTFRLARTGYREAAVRLDVKVDERTEHMETLQKAEGWLRVETTRRDASGQMQIGREAARQVSLPWTSGAMPPGDVSIVFTPQTGGRFTANGTVEDGKTNVVRIALADQPEEGKDWRVADPAMLLKWIPRGSFMMGSTKAERDWAADPNGGKGEASWFTDERDPFRVSVDGYWLGETPVTVGQWKRFIADTGYRTDAEKQGQAWTLDGTSWGYVKGKSWRDPGLQGYTPQDNHPVVCISWNDAMEFCRWLTQRERDAVQLPDHLEYRLPGEAEWEYACRGGREGTRFWWGNDVAGGRGRLNIAGTDKLPGGSTWSQNWGFDDGYPYIAPVNAFGANGRNDFGLADMLGNVWEWCYDGYDSNRPHPTIWQGDTSRRVLRGGSFNTHPDCVRCAYRGGDPPASPFAHVGFRVALGVVVRQE